ncbi:MAG TPA: molybdopterin-guanine dinucleotide biosynthesis protein B [Candidatus Hydrogenedentes bacterium]|nr:molybdopterin-guanine dinucleotide biosynthesis protein B [Candidatus Hydrogenedentota bacterium]HOV73259.1 molybdopterin-guanine dinucleotide biosynthesis protein B [Candidatus Hydrogenedentota bacterium]
MDENVLARLPVLLITGYSGSGKTTVIEQLIPRLIADGLTVAVIKHDTHGLHVDRPGKDSDRFFQAGATVIAHGPNEAFLRVPPERAWDLEAAAIHLLKSHDLVLVEGHKKTPIQAKIWLRGEADDPPPPEASDAIMDLKRADPRLERIYAFIHSWMEKQWLGAPVHAGILIGGQSSRMGRPKHLIEQGGATWMERIAASLAGHADSVVVLGKGELPPALHGLPRLADAAGSSGPIAGMRAAMRWDPLASWLFVACDMPLVNAEAVAWLLGHRAPGRWAVMPRSGPGRVEPLFALYDFRAASFIEKVDGPRSLVDFPHVYTADIPDRLRDIWKNFNSDGDLRAIEAQD